MLKNLIVLLVTLLLCAALVWWVAPMLQPEPNDTLPGYGDLVDYDPDRLGGHLRPNMDTLVRGERHGAGVRWITNSQGYRNEGVIAPDSPPGTLRILFYGDSFVDGMRTGQDDTIGAHLQRVLAEQRERPVEVIISGHNNLANAWYHWQRHGHRLRPHVVLLGLTVGNDLTSHNFGAGVLPVARSLDELVTVDRAAPMAGVGSATAMIPEDGFVPARQRVSFQVWGTAANDAIARRLGFLAHRATPAMGPRPGEPGRAHAAGFFTSLGLFYRGEIPFIEAAWSDFETLLPGFAAQIRHHGARPLLVSFPTRIETLDRDWQRLVRALQLDPKRFDLGRATERIRAACEAADVPCFDSAASLRSGQSGGEVFRPLGDMHLSDHGQATIAKGLGDFVLSQLAEPRRASPDETWLSDYREQLASWASGRIALEAPWVQQESGGLALTLNDHATEMATLLTDGWRSNEGNKPFWSAASEASIRIPVARLGHDLALTLNAKPFLAEPNERRQRVALLLGDTLVEAWDLSDDDFAPRSVVLPAEHLVAPWTRLTLSLPDAIVPADHGLSADRRQLGLAVIGIELQPATE